jgi:ribonuclease P protein component
VVASCSSDGERRGAEETRSSRGGCKSLARFQRLRDPRDFERVYAARQAVHTRSLVLFACPNGLSFARLGVSVGKKHGGAVRRNRIKRVLRAAFRLSRHLLPPGNDYVLVPRRGDAACTTAGVCETLQGVARKLARATRGTDSRRASPPGGEQELWARSSAKCATETEISPDRLAQGERVIGRIVIE